MKKHSKQILDS